MLDRLMGTETEYAIRYEVPPDTPHPGNEDLFGRITAAVQRLVHTREAEGFGGGRCFTENGGSFVFEQTRPDRGGLFEAATPECRGPAQLLLYQRAQDALLARAVAEAASRMRHEGHDGRLGLLKNCRDAVGNVYGAQESYEVPVAKGPRLVLWWATLGVAAALAMICAPLVFAWLVLGVGLLFGGAAAVIGVATSRDRPIDWEAWFTRLATHVLVVPVTALFQPPLFVIALGARAFAYRPYRRHAMGFLVSRSAISGAGTRRADGGWSLSEKLGDIRSTMRWTVLTSDRGMLEIGHLMKPVQALTLLRWRAFADGFRRKQRLQLGMADANRCDVAEYLKVGTTALVLDMVEAGVLDDAPRPRRPARSARALSDDASLRATVPLRGGGQASALELQRFYADRAAEWIASTPAPLEAHKLVELWQRTLDQLESDPEALVGRIDWVTKRALVDGASTGDPLSDKKIDLRYHELGDEGYFTWLVDEGLAERLVAEEAVRQAIVTPPEDTPARQRGELVRALSASETPARVGWNRVRLGGPLRGEIIRLDDHR